ncbi:MAG TPA: hypothetical protein VFU04_06645, partial [Solirubrobacterales bacterium]|nr:hypothetical protein [Solirubrobacterales bacterium]
VDAAERAAASVIDEAEKEAQKHVAEAKARADKIVAQRLRELADQLDPPAEGERRHLRPVDSAESDVAEVTVSGNGPRRSTSAGARLLATQMAVSGARRDEIEARLRSGFEIEDAAEIVDAILGPEE